jgi:hypothetical protein
MTLLADTVTAGVAALADGTRSGARPSGRAAACARPAVIAGPPAPAAAAAL